MMVWGKGKREERQGEGGMQKEKKRESPCAGTGRPKQDIWWIPLSSPLYCLETGSMAQPETHDLDQASPAAGSQDLPFMCSPMLGFQAHQWSAFYLSARDLNSVPGLINRRLLPTPLPLAGSYS